MKYNFIPKLNYEEGCLCYWDCPEKFCTLEKSCFVREKTDYDKETLYANLEIKPQERIELPTF